MTRKRYRFIKKCKNFLVFYCLICVLFISSYTFSRHITTASGETNISVATPVLNLIKDTADCSLDNMLPGDSRECVFYVSNKYDTKENEVLLDYYFIIKLNSVVPLNMLLYDGNGNEININKNGETATESMGYIENGSNQEIKRKYVLKVSWTCPKNYEETWKTCQEDIKNSDYAGKTIDINVQLKGTQVISES